VSGMIWTKFLGRSPYLTSASASPFCSRCKTEIPAKHFSQGPILPTYGAAIEGGQSKHLRADLILSPLIQDIFRYGLGCKSPSKAR